MFFSGLLICFGLVVRESGDDCFFYSLVLCGCLFCLFRFFYLFVCLLVLLCALLKYQGLFFSLIFRSIDVHVYSVMLFISYLFFCHFVKFRVLNFMPCTFHLLHYDVNTIYVCVKGKTSEDRFED